MAAGRTRPPVDEQDFAEPASSKSLSERAYCRLRDMILTGQLAPNAALQERRLAEALNISRTPIREALSRLESEGMIIRQAGRFPVVRQWTVQEYIEILNVRRVLEMEAAGLAAAGRVTREEAMRVRAAINELMDASAPTSTQHWHCDDMIHSLISNGSGNSVLAELIQDLRLRTRMFDFTMLPERFKPGCLEHLDIVDAVMEGDAARARTVMADHIDNVKLSILQKLQQM